MKISTNIHKLVPETREAPPVWPNVNTSTLAILGDVPYDELAVMPFSNAHYGTVAGLCRRAGFAIENVPIANLLNSYPQNGAILDSHRLVIETQLNVLEQRFNAFGVKTILLLGRQALSWLKTDNGGLDEERGAPFKWRGFTVIPTFHPRELYAQWNYYEVVLADYRKAVEMPTTWQPIQYQINYQPTFPEVVTFLRFLIDKKPWCSVDLESRHSSRGQYSLLTCIGFSFNGKTGFVIPFERAGGKHYFELDQEIIVLRLLATALRTARFLGHNATQYDMWFLAYWYGIYLNVIDDTMFLQWEIYTEMEKSLAFCSSLYTFNQYHKDVLKLSRTGKLPREQEFYYCGVDNIVTRQVYDEQVKEMSQLPLGVRQHYRFNIKLSRVFMYMSLRGARLDVEKRNARVEALEKEANEMQEKLNTEAKKVIMVTSPQKMKKWLYEELRLPVRHKLVKLDDGSTEERETADFLTLAYLARERPEMPALWTAAQLRKLKKRISSLRSIETLNGRIFWNFSVVGTDSGRASGYKPNNGYGVQPQNPDKRDRDLFLPPEPGQVWAKCDLEGADAWTVAGQLVTLGDDTMFKDLKAGLKPAMILALARHLGQHLISATQEELKPLVREHKAFFKTPAGKQIYDTTKSVSHGTNYMMQAPTMHMTIFSKTKAELFVPVRECEALRQLYLKRYWGLEKLYTIVATMINTDGYLDCPSGMRRKFFGRADNSRTRVGLSFLPQNNTAYATNRALLNLFNEPYNRRADGKRLIVEPINQVHDEADLVFFPEEIETVRSVFARATDFGSEIWGVPFVIPFDPNYGPNWGDCDENLFAE